MLLYLLKTTACLGIFLLFYKLLLEKENMNVFKRFYLLTSIIVAFIIPSLVFVEYVAPVTTLQSFNHVLDDAPLTLSQDQVKDIEVINWSLLAWSIYSLGVFIFGIRFFRNLFEILGRIRKNTQIKEDFSIKVLLLEQLPPHTFFKYIFLNKQKFKANSIPLEVLLHEEVHAKQYHSIDVLFIEILQVVFWFNPLFYFFKRSIKLNHEFLADSGVIQETISASNYQNTLLSYLSKDSITTHPSIRMANAINYSSIKKRFKVMKTQTSKKGMLLRVFLLLPLVALMLYGFSETKYVERTTEIYTNSNTNFHPEYEDLSSNNKPEKRIITLTGLIIDSETLKPIVNVEIYDSNGKSISKTDSKGYYKIDLTIEQEGEIFFNLLLKKEGYKPFLQREHWGDLKGKIEASLFVGLEKKASDYPQFSDLFTNALNISDQVVQDYIKSVKNRLDFEEKMNTAKEGNQNVFLQISDVYYLVNNSGWIKLESKNDLVSVNENQNIPASQLNQFLKRKDITGMTPVSDKIASYAMYTIPVDNTVKPIKSDIKLEKRASRAQVRTYNALAKMYNEMPRDNMQISVKDVEQLKYIYSIMTDKQKAEAEPFPDFPEPPPAPEAPKTPLNKSNKKKTIEQQDKNPKTGFIEVNGQTLYYVSKKGEVTYYNRSGQKVNRNGNIIDQKQAHAEEIIEGQIISKIYKDDKVVAEFNTENVSIQSPLKPSPPFETLDHLIHMTKKGAVFYYEGKEISSEKAIELIEKNRDLNILISEKDSNKPQVKITVKPINIGNIQNKKIFDPILGYTINKTKEIPDQAIQYKNENSSSFESLIVNAQKKDVTFYYDNKPISITQARHLLFKYKNTAAVVSHLKYPELKRLDIITDVGETTKEFISKQYEAISL